MPEGGLHRAEADGYAAIIRALGDKRDCRRNLMKVIFALAITAMVLLASCADPVATGAGTPSAKATGMDTSHPIGTTSPAPSPIGTSATAVCVMSTANGQCGPYSYPANTASSGYNTYVGQNVFNPIRGWQQTLHSAGPGSWYVTANMPAGNTAVVSYPSTGQGSSGDGTTQRISSYTTITSTFAENMHSGPRTDAEAAYDIWTAAGDEIMIQHDFSVLRPRCAGAYGDPVQATVGFAEPGTATVQNWNFCQYGDERIWQFANGNEHSGSVDILAMLTWLMNHGYLRRDSELGLVGYGFEVCSTGGADETFSVSRFSLTALPNP